MIEQGVATGHTHIRWWWLVDDTYTPHVYDMVYQLVKESTAYMARLHVNISDEASINLCTPGVIRRSLFKCMWGTLFGVYTCTTKYYSMVYIHLSNKVSPIRWQQHLGDVAICSVIHTLCTPPYIDITPIQQPSWNTCSNRWRVYKNNELVTWLVDTHITHNTHQVVYTWWRYLQRHVPDIYK